MRSFNTIYLLVSILSITSCCHANPVNISPDSSLLPRAPLLPNTKSGNEPTPQTWTMKTYRNEKCTSSLRGTSTGDQKTYTGCHDFEDVDQGVAFNATNGGHIILYFDKGCAPTVVHTKELTKEICFKLGQDDEWGQQVTKYESFQFFPKGT